MEYTENTIFAVLYKGGHPVSLHFFELDPWAANSGLNRAFRSYSAFRRKQQSNLSKANARAAKQFGKIVYSPDFVYVRTDWVETNSYFETDRKVLYKGLPIHIHADHAEFYTAVEYDVKTKRFL